MRPWLLILAAATAAGDAIAATINPFYSTAVAAALASARAHNIPATTAAAARHSLCIARPVAV